MKIKRNIRSDNEKITVLIVMDILVISLFICMAAIIREKIFSFV